MARKRLSVEGLLVGYFATIALSEGYRLLDMAKGILAARTKADPVMLQPTERKPRPIRKRRARPVADSIESAGQ